MQTNQEADRLYMISKYDEDLKHEYQTRVRELKENNFSLTKGLNHIDSLALKQAFSEKLSIHLNIEEKRNNNTVVECITNTKLDDSYIVFS